MKGKRRVVHLREGRLALIPVGSLLKNLDIALRIETLSIDQTPPPAA